MLRITDARTGVPVPLRRGPIRVGVEVRGHDGGALRVLVVADVLARALELGGSTVWSLLDAGRDEDRLRGAAAALGARPFERDRQGGTGGRGVRVTRAEEGSPERRPGARPAARGAEEPPARRPADAPHAPGSADAPHAPGSTEPAHRAGGMESAHPAEGSESGRPAEGSEPAHPVEAREPGHAAGSGEPGQAVPRAEQTPAVPEPEAPPALPGPEAALTAPRPGAAVPDGRAEPLITVAPVDGEDPLPWLGTDPGALRLALLSRPRTEPICLDAAAFDRAAATLARWRGAVARWSRSPSRPVPEPVRTALREAWEDDVDVPAVLDVLARVETADGLPDGARFETCLYADRLLGLELARDLGACA